MYFHDFERHDDSVFSSIFEVFLQFSTLRIFCHIFHLLKTRFLLIHRSGAFQGLLWGFNYRLVPSAPANMKDKVYSVITLITGNSSGSFSIRDPTTVLHLSGRRSVEPKILSHWDNRTTVGIWWVNIYGDLRVFSPFSRDNLLTWRKIMTKPFFLIFWGQLTWIQEKLEEEFIESPILSSSWDRPVPLVESSNIPLKNLQSVFFPIRGPMKSPCRDPSSSCFFLQETSSLNLLISEQTHD